MFSVESKTRQKGLQNNCGLMYYVLFVFAFFACAFLFLFVEQVSAELTDPERERATVQCEFNCGRPQ